MELEQAYIDALIELHRGLKRQGPGDDGFAARLLADLPPLPARPRIADLGCGAGAGALLLARHYRATVRAVDFAAIFVEQMMHEAGRQGLADYIEPIVGDMARLDWAPASIDLLWSEGAAYSITFAGALRAWRPLLAANGVAVISEMNHFCDPPAPAVRDYMADAYPGMQTEAANVELINASGFAVKALRRLPTAFWWDNYYEPLRANMAALAHSPDDVMQAVIADTAAEMQFFRDHHRDYGYTYYVMTAA